MGCRFLLLCLTINLATLTVTLPLHASSGLKFLSSDRFEKLPEAKKKLYISELRKNYSLFERMTNLRVRFVEDRKHSPYFELIDTAYAEDGGKCLIGGVIRNLVGDKCSTKGRPCPGVGGDSFMCGKIYGNHCLKNREPIADISSRCQKEAPPTKMTKEEYQKIANEIDAGFRAVCRPVKEGYQEPCQFLDERLNSQLDQIDNNKVAEKPQQAESTPTPSKPESASEESGKGCKWIESTGFKIKCPEGSSSSSCGKSKKYCSGFVACEADTVFVDSNTKKKTKYSKGIISMACESKSGGSCSSVSIADCYSDSTVVPSSPGSDTIGSDGRSDWSKENGSVE